MTTTILPPFYAFFFTYFDPLISLSGAITDFIAPNFVVNSLVPASHLHTPSLHLHYNFIFQQAGGSMLAVSFLSGVLLRSSTDLKVWKHVQTAILLIDLATLYSAWDALRLQDRLEFRTWRGEDWGTVGLTAFVTVLRVAFLAEVGFRRGRGKKAN